MTTESMTKAEARRRRREAVAEAAIAKEMSDTRWDRLRTPVARRALVVLWVAATLAIGIAWPIGVVGSWALVGLPVWIVVFYALRRSVRALADIPDEFLDERQVAVRDRVYLHAYRLFAAAVLILLFALSIIVDRHTLTYEDMSGAMWAALGLSLGLPSAVLAWTTTDT